MHVDLTPELEELVQSKVKSGRYNSASEVVREALRILEQRDEVFALRKEDIRKQIDEGWQSAKRGEFADGDEVFDRIDAALEAMAVSYTHLIGFGNGDTAGLSAAGAEQVVASLGDLQGALDLL